MKSTTPKIHPSSSYASPAARRRLAQSQRLGSLARGWLQGPGSSRREQYVLGFAFNLDCSRVLLVCKNRPDWQRDKFNGVGGRIENEGPVQAMVREFFEETGVSTMPDHWKLFARHHSRGDLVFCFAAIIGKFHRARTVTDEVVARCPVESLPAASLPQLHWMIPLAINKLGRDPGLDHVTIDEHLSHLSSSRRESAHNQSPLTTANGLPLCQNCGQIELNCCCVTFRHPSAYTRL